MNSQKAKAAGPSPIKATPTLAVINPLGNFPEPTPKEKTPAQKSEEEAKTLEENLAEMQRHLDEKRKKN